MGNQRFRFSDMIPNSWFHKLRNRSINHPRKKKTPPTPSKPSSSSSLSSSSTSSSSSSSSNAAAIPPQLSITEQPHLLSHQRKSYYFTRELTPPSPRSQNHTTQKIPNTHFPKSPRKSSKQRISSTRKNRAPKLVTASSVSAGCSCRTTIESVWTRPDSISEDYLISPLDSSSDIQSLFPEFGSDHDHDRGMVSCSSSSHCRVQKDIFIDMNDKSSSTNFDGFDTFSRLELPPISTKKPTKFSNATIQDITEPEKQRTSAKFVGKIPDGNSLSVKVLEEEKISISSEQRSSPVRRLSVSSPGVKIRANSPRIASRKMQAYGRKSCRRGRRSLSESFAVVKSSADPQRDFRESMVEMILENNLRASKDLEDLLACYLQLNSDEYHEVIVKVFKQIWFDLAQVRLK